MFWCRYADSLPAGFAERIARELEVRIHGRYDGHFVSPLGKTTCSSSG